VTDAVTTWLVKSDPTLCAGVELVYTIGPPPEYLGSSPYWNTAVVGRPPGLTEPENPAEPPPTLGVPVITGDGSEATITVPWATVLAPPTSEIEILVL
jgi:hypothetical protein